MNSIGKIVNPEKTREKQRNLKVPWKLEIKGIKPKKENRERKIEEIKNREEGWKDKRERSVECAVHIHTPFLLCFFFLSLLLLSLSSLAMEITT